MSAPGELYWNQQEKNKISNEDAKAANELKDLLNGSLNEKQFANLSGAVDSFMGIFGYQ